MAAHPRVVAIGECGLDYYWPTEKPYRELDEEKVRQRELFEAQITIALQVNKPLMIHGRPSKGSMDAYEDILAILKNHPGIRGNVHFFVGDINIAKQFLDIGFTMSFTGVLTFTHDYDDVVLYIPSDFLMSETDAPYVAPVPHRGKRNEPLFVRETVAAIARIRGEHPEQTAEILCANASRYFCL
jgi:TatD DNase family protein